MLSFIMPAYNAEETINSSIDSVLIEKDVSFELIIVDDGSTDSTGLICDRISESDPRVNVTHIKNCGQGFARNIGIDIAKGEYIAFIDSDDLLLWDGVKQLLSIAECEMCDIVCGNYYCINGSKRCLGTNNISSGKVVHSLNKNSIYQKLKSRSTFGYIWNKIYRKAFIDGNNIRFDDVNKINLEDTLFNLKLFCHNPQYIYYDIAVYEYYVRTDSSCHKVSEDIAPKNSAMINLMCDYYRNKGKYDEYSDILTLQSLRIFCWSVFKSGEIDSQTLHKSISCFSHEKEFVSIVEKEENFHYLNLAPSLLQRSVFKYCFKLLHSKKYKSIESFFKIALPFMKIYNYLQYVK